MRRVLLLLALGTSSLVLTVGPSAAANDTTCVGFLTGTFDNIVVPEDADCILTRSLVHGNVLALPDARLTSDSNDIRGNILGDNADVINVIDRPDTPGGSVVGGDIQAVDGGGSTGLAFNALFRVCGTELPNNGDIQVARFRPPAVAGGRSFVAIGDTANCPGFLGGGNIVSKGNIQVVENTLTGTMGVELNQVGENLQVFKNTGPGAKTVTENRVGESLQCFKNDPPFVGTPNVAREAQGQCGATPLP